MLTLKKRLAAIIFLALFSAATIVSCGKLSSNPDEGNTVTEEQDTSEHPSDSTDHPSESSEHPADSTKNQ